MAVPWLDLARFADTVGYHGDQNQHIFPYRDYVIDAFNKNLPFDRFTREQLAGDLLPDPSPDQLVATGFNRLNMMTREGGAQPGEYLAKYAGDRVRTVAITWLGSTMGCAECHDHKFDPFTARDFYRMAAFFGDVKQWGVYMDYGYTPNPELRGFSNDHPFPPEIEVGEPLPSRPDRQARRADPRPPGRRVDRSIRRPLSSTGLRGLGHERPRPDRSRAGRVGDPRGVGRGDGEPGRPRIVEAQPGGVFFLSGKVEAEGGVDDPAVPPGGLGLLDPGRAAPRSRALGQGHPKRGPRGRRSGWRRA